jgi:AAA-like domain/GUN4-like
MFDEYRFSGSLPENASTYVTREADEELYQSLYAGKFCYVLNTRQSGKSSIRVRTMRRLRDAGVECAAIDLSAGGVQNVTPEQWYVDIIDHLIESFALDVDLVEWWSENKLYSEVTRFRKFIEEVLLLEVKEKIVIFIDEIDSVLSLKFPTDDFFALIRACHNQRVDNLDYNRLTFCLLGVASPGNLIQDKQRTPFNIGTAINLKGFQLHEVSPLRQGLDGKFTDSQKIIEEILNWTGGQPFLTQKLCYFMVEESQKDNPRSVEQVARARIIENWELQDEPEHLRTICSRILRDEERAAYLLDLYQQIRNSADVVNNDSVEQSELLLSGLVTKQQNKLQVSNLIYQEIFNQNWVEGELKKLRPYSEAFRAWVASGFADESRLLRGNALFDAEEWAKDKNLSYQDKEFLAASRKKQTQEEIAAQEKEAQLERERKDREATEQRNKALAEANKKAKQMIRNGVIILIMTLLGAAISVKTATDKVAEAQQQLQEVYTYVANPQQLKELAVKLPLISEEANSISKKENIAIKIKDAQIQQAYLHASKSLAYQYIGKWDSVEESIKQSMIFLRGWKENKKYKEHKESEINFLQTKIFALNIQGNLLTKQGNTQKAIEAYKEAFDILQNSKINPFKEELSIVDNETVKSVCKELLNLLTNQNQGDLQVQVKEFLKQHLYAGLKYSLEAKNWQEADITTSQLMLYIADREERGWLDIPSIETFSCNELKRIDDYWVKNSNGYFGFSVQKDIYIKTGNRLGVKPQDWNSGDDTNYLNFARQIGWYDKINGFMLYEDYMISIKDNSINPKGGLPTSGLQRVLWRVVRGSGNEGWFFSRFAACKV